MEFREALAFCHSRLARRPFFGPPRLEPPVSGFGVPDAGSVGRGGQEGAMRASRGRAGVRRLHYCVSGAPEAVEECEDDLA